MYKIERTDSEINDVLNEAAENEDAGRSKFPGMTYEQGVQAGINWVTGQSSDSPMEE